MIASLGGLGAATATLLPIVAVLAGITVAIVHVQKEAYRLQTAYQDLKSSSDAAIQAAEAEAKVHAGNALEIGGLSILSDLKRLVLHFIHCIDTLFLNS
jgi:hypothetical protein